jgi:hypothetical protein
MDASREIKGMNKITRRLGTGMMAAAGLMMLVGCGNSAQGGNEPGERVGQLALPLVTQGASGVVYRLRDATFTIRSLGNSGWAGSGSGGSSGAPPITVSSETDPDAPTISVSVEEGQYYVELSPGWHFEKITPEGAVPVEATLLYGETQWVWVSRRSTSFAEFQFGLGGREIWLNGDLNIGVVLYEDPSEIGYGGSAGSGGFPNGGFAGSLPAGGFAGSTSGGSGPALP